MSAPMKLPVQVITSQENLLLNQVIMVTNSANTLNGLGLELPNIFQTSYLLARMARATGFGANLRRLCEFADLQANELAARVGVKPPTMSRWMALRKPPAAGTLFKLAKALRCEVEAFLVGIDADYDAMRIDLIRQTHDQQSTLTPVVKERGLDVSASGAAGGDLVERVQRLERELAATREIANRFAGLLEQSGVPAKARPAAKSTAGVRRGHRKTG